VLHAAKWLDDSNCGPPDLVLWCSLLANEKAFDHALATAYAERMRSGRSRSSYQVSESATPSSNSADIELLKTDLQALFQDLDGSGRKLKIDVFGRRTCSIRGGPTARVIHYTVYGEGLPESSVEFERDEPKRRTRRPVIEAAICFEPETGILDVMSKGGKDTREGIARSFAIRLMGSDEELQPVRRRDFESRPIEEGKATTTPSLLLRCVRRFMTPVIHTKTLLNRARCAF
jgi:hypothetical protein